MKIAFIGGRNLHLLGGIENYMLNLATQLVRLGHEPIVYCESDHDGEETINGFKVIHMKGPKSVYLCKPWLGVKATIHAIRNFKDLDLIHYNACGPAWGQYIARLCSKPYLIQGHGLEWERTKYSSKKRAIIKVADTFQMRFSRNVIVVSDVQRDYWFKALGKNAVTVPTAINLPDYGWRGDESILSRFNLRKGNYFLFLARLVKEKNPDILINSFLKASPKGFKLVIAGNNTKDPDFVSYLHSLAKNNPDVVFTDAVYGDDKETLLRNAFAFCVPSSIEGLSISLLEGMAYKLRIVASDIPANMEVLERDKAYLCHAEDEDGLAEAISNCVADTDATEKVDYNYRKVETDYVWPKVTERYTDYISKLISSC